MDRIDEMTLLLAIAETGSLAAAGRVTGRSPSSVSRILDELETRLGARLVERNTRRLAMTERGHRFAEHARRLVADFDAAMRDVGEQPGEPAGHLRISAPNLFGRRHVAPLLGAFLDRHPRVTAELALDDRVADLQDGRFDIAIRIGDAGSASLACRQIGAVRRILVASPAYLAQHGRPETADDLAAHQAILFTNDAYRADWRAIQLSGRLRVNRAEAAIDAALDGRGILRVLSYQVADDLVAGRLVRLLPELEPLPVPVRLVFAQARFLPAAQRAFIDFVAPRLRRLPALAAL
jgi:DNA-binding transcriptional LysR family regulator